MACKAILKHLSDAGRITIDASGLPTNGNGVTASQAFEMMCAEPDTEVRVQVIHNHLLAKGIWCWTKGTIESHLGLASKAPAAHMAFLRDLGSQAFRDGLPDYVSAQTMMNWLRQD